MLSRRQVSELIGFIRERMSIVARWVGLNESAPLNWEYNDITVLRIYLSRSGALIHRCRPLTRTKEIAAMRLENYKEMKKGIGSIIRDVAEDLVMDLFFRKYKHNYDLELRFTLKSANDFSWKFVIEKDGKTEILAEGKEDESPVEVFPVVAKICVISKL
jgi:hypothetical protein